MTRVLFLTKYGRKAASTRLRMLQYFPMLEDEGITSILSPLFDDSYLAHKFSHGTVSARKALPALLRRTGSMVRAGQADVIVLQYELFPYLPGFLELLLRATKIPYVYDFDDAVFHAYDLHRSSLVRLLLRNKIRNAIKGARAVLAGSPYLVEYARTINPHVEWAPTCVDISRFPVKRWDDPAEKPFTIGWIGAPSSVQFAAEAIPAIRELAKRIPVRLVYVGSGAVRYDGCVPEIREWSEATEVSEMLQFDVGIMPLPDEPWTRGKCAFKLIQYMACGLPVIASPVGMNRDVVTAGENGFLASSTAEWLQAFDALAARVDLRRAMGTNGRRRVERDFTTQVGGATLLRAIRSAAGVGLETLAVEGA